MVIIMVKRADMAKTIRTYSQATREAAQVLGKLIRLERKERRMTEADLAARAGISRTTLQKIEQGDLKCELGLVFEVATIVGVTLYGADNSSTVTLYHARLNEKLALLPHSVRVPKVDDEF